MIEMKPGAYYYVVDCDACHQPIAFAQSEGVDSEVNYPSHPVEVSCLNRACTSHRKAVWRRASEGYRYQMPPTRP
jgi:hypothetical protein